MWNKALNIAGWAIGVICLFVLLGAAVSESSAVVLRAVQVEVDFGDENYFIKEDQVKEIIADLGYMGDTMLIRDIDPGRIEHILENNAYISDAEVYKELNGDLHVDVTTRQPIMRIYNLRGESVYIDEDGVFMPLSPQYASRAPIVNGMIVLDFAPFIGRSISDLRQGSESKDIATIAEVYDIVRFCREEELWKAQFNQFYVNHEREIELIPRVGDHHILVGNAQDIDKKLNKLRMFYEKGLSKTGWNEYKVINLKYANQVVCTKS